jgi:hypothetical protein
LEAADMELLASHGSRFINRLTWSSILLFDFLPLLNWMTGANL